MDNKPNSRPETVDPTHERHSRLLDPFEEWRDHANQWDMSGLQNSNNKRQEEEKERNARTPHTL